MRDSPQKAVPSGALDCLDKREQAFDPTRRLVTEPVSTKTQRKSFMNELPLRQHDPSRISRNDPAMETSRPLFRPETVAGFFLMLAIFSGCTLDFTGDRFQRLELFLTSSEALTAGDSRLVHTSFFPDQVTVRKRWVRISGRVDAAGAGPLPARVAVVARFEDAESGRQQSRVSLNLGIKTDGTFSARKRLKKNIEAESMMTVSLSPTGTDFPVGAAVRLCVDLAESKKDLGRTPDCSREGGDDGGGGNGAVTLTELQSSLFTPTCALAGCHNAASARAGLVLEDGLTFEETVNVASSQVPSIDIVEPGDPERSYLIKKLRGDSDISGARMPDGGPFLSAERIADVASWIDSGAPEN
jgi:hypothetical protein